MSALKTIQAGSIRYANAKTIRMCTNVRSKTTHTLY